MRRPLIAAALLAAACASAAAAQVPSQLSPAGAWQVEAERIALPAARVSLPRTIGTASMVRTGEFAKPGSGLDNYVQFETPDRKLFGTVYVYRTTYADAALAGYATERAIRQRFGPAAVNSARAAVPAFGRSGGAIRIVYDGGTYGGETVTTAAAFARVDGWLVKMRATGSSARRAEVLAILDATIAGLRADPSATVYPARPLDITAPCPASATASPAKEVRGRTGGAQALLGGLFGGSIVVRDRTTGGTLPPAFPANGATPVCVRGTMRVDGETVELLQPAGTTTPDVLLGALSDAGDVLAVQASPLGGFGVTTYGVGDVRAGGTLDRLPTTAQLEGWVASRGRTPITARAITSVAADGNVTTSVDGAVLR